jgi:hypothetical protein
MKKPQFFKFIEGPYSAGSKPRPELIFISQGAGLARSLFRKCS